MRCACGMQLHIYICVQRAHESMHNTTMYIESISKYTYTICRLECISKIELECISKMHWNAYQKYISITETCCFYTCACKTRIRIYKTRARISHAQRIHMQIHICILECKNKMHIEYTNDIRVRIEYISEYTEYTRTYHTHRECISTDTYALRMHVKNHHFNQFHQCNQTQDCSKDQIKTKKIRARNKTKTKFDENKKK